MTRFNSNNVGSPVPENQGGTGATSFAGAKANMFAEPLGIALGGTGAQSQVGAMYNTLPPLFFNKLLKDTIPSFAGWFRADAGIAQDLSGSVTATTWTEYTGTGMTFSQANKPNQPLVVTVNGSTALHFDGTDDNMSGGTLLKALTKDKPGLTFIATCQSLVNGVNQDLFHFSTPTAANARARYRKTSSNVDNILGRSTDSDAAPTSRTGTLGPGLNPAIIASIFNFIGTTATIYNNGAQSASGTNFTSSNTSNTDSAVVYIGSGNAAQYWNGYIWDLMILTSAATSAERLFAQALLSHLRRVPIQ